MEDQSVPPIPVSPIPVPKTTIKPYPATIAGLVIFAIILGKGIQSGLPKQPHETYPPPSQSESSALASNPHSQNPNSQDTVAFLHRPAPNAPNSIWINTENVEIAAHPNSAPNQGLEPDQAPAHLGALRVGNQTTHPIRVALLQRTQVHPAPVHPAPVHPAQVHPATSESHQAPSTLPPEILTEANLNPSLNLQLEPVHWDFAPGEGGYQGLLLSLPGGDLQLQPGDVLIAFAQDGSQQYWGPYVVGETPIPQWNPAYGEWQLRLEDRS